MIIKRERYLSKIRAHYDVDIIKVLTGVRRAGKSVLLKQIKDEILNNGIEEDHIIYINFEDLTYTQIKDCMQLNEYVLQRIKDLNKYYIFLDEIQHVKSFERGLASLKATQNVSIFVTGSNSKLLSGTLATLLVGRCVEFKILPFSYAEMIEYLKENKKQETEDSLNDYLLYGGLPQRFKYDNKNEIEEYLESIYNGIVNKDICTNLKINKEKFLIVANYVLSNIGKRFSASNVAEYFEKENDDSLTRAMIYRYIEYLEKACLISRVERYDVSSKRIMKMIEKHYLVDVGFKTIMTKNKNEALSRNLENIIYNELILRGYKVYIGKTYKGEIDFVVIKGRKKCFIQVAYLLADEEVVKREFRAFDSVKDSAPKYVFSLDRYDMSEEGIAHINIEKFLKGEQDITLL